MISRRETESFFTGGYRQYLPHVSVDCVAFGFQEDALKVLLLKWKGGGTWTLPGGYVKRRESLDEAAVRVLRDRTGLRRVFLRQFHTFGGVGRKERTLGLLCRRLGLAVPRGAWPLGRVVSIGYYALVDSSRVRPQTDYVSEACGWHPADGLPPLAFDHARIAAAALEVLRGSLDSARVGSTLLPPRFTMPELQRLHEAILGRTLDRRNFQKLVLERGIVVRLPERRTGGAHRAPFLYRFSTARERG